MKRSIALLLLIAPLLVACAMLAAPTTPPPTATPVIQTVEVIQTVMVTSLVEITTTPVPTATSTTPAPLIYEEDFENPDVDGWMLFEAGVIEQGQLTITGIDPNTTSYVTQSNFDGLTSFDLQFDLVCLAGTVPTTAGLLFRSETESWLELVVDPSGYLALLAFDGTQYQTLMPWVSVRGLKTNGDPNRLHIIDDGIVIQVFVNDEQVLKLPVEAYTGRSSAFFVDAYDKGGAAWAVDNIVLRELH
jgi:hypothetical protein